MKLCIPSVSKPAERVSYCSLSIIFLFSAMASVGYTSIESDWMLVAYRILFPLSALAWTLHTIGRLIDLQQSPRWTIVVVLPWAVMIWAVWRGRPLILGIAFAILTAVQLSLILLPSRTRSVDGESDRRAELEKCVQPLPRSKGLV